MYEYEHGKMIIVIIKVIKRKNIIGSQNNPSKGEGNNYHRFVLKDTE